MASYTDWEIEGVEFVNCSCDCGCPCQFNSLPTHGHCHAHTFVHIDRGRYGDVTLDGFALGFLAAWPDPSTVRRRQSIGRGGRARRSRRRAALDIAHGRDTEPGSSVLQVFSTTVTILPTVCSHRPVDRRRERTVCCCARRACDSTAAPIRNKKTGAPQRRASRLPPASNSPVRNSRPGRRSDGRIPLDFSETHAPGARALVRTASSVALQVKWPTAPPRARGDPRSLARVLGRCCSSPAPAGGGWCRWHATCTEA